MLFVIYLFFVSTVYGGSNDCFKNNYYAPLREKEPIISQRSSGEFVKFEYLAITDLPNNAFLHYNPKDFKIYEFRVTNSTFDIPIFDFGTAAFHKYLQSIAISNSSLELVFNSKKHCSDLFPALHVVDLNNNKITSIDGEIFQNMPLLTNLFLFKNQIHTISYIESIIAKPINQKIFVGFVNVLACPTLHRIIYSLTEEMQSKIHLRCNRTLPNECSRVPQINCPDDQFVSFPNLKPYLSFVLPRNNAVFTNITKQWLYLSIAIHFVTR